MIALQQTVDIPADHRLVIDVPKEIPAGMARISLFFDGFNQERLDRLEREKASAKSKYKSLVDMIGSCKGLDTMEEYFERKQADKAHETRQEQGYL